MKRSPANEPVVRRAIGEVERCCVVKRHVVGDVVDLMPWRGEDHTFCKGAVACHCQHPVTDREVRDLVSDAGHDASTLASRHKRRIRAELIKASDDKHIGIIHRRRVNAHH